VPNRIGKSEVVSASLHEELTLVSPQSGFVVDKLDEPDQLLIEVLDLARSELIAVVHVFRLLDHFQEVRTRRHECRRSHRKDGVTGDVASLRGISHGGESEDRQDRKQHPRYEAEAYNADCARFPIELHVASEFAPLTCA
jgi:hypothetical protein